MTRSVLTYISVPLYKQILKEKEELMKKEGNKIKSRRKRITLAMASQSLVRRLK